MKLLTFFGFLLLSASAASAQPVRDINDAQEAVRAHIRDMQPLVEQMREVPFLLKMFADVQRDLAEESQPFMALDRSLRDLDDYESGATRRQAVLDKEARSYVQRTRTLLESARNGAPYGTLTDLREKIHHNAIHPIERRIIATNRQIDIIIRGYESIAMQFRLLETANYGGLERLSMDPEKP